MIDGLGKSSYHANVVRKKFFGYFPHASVVCIFDKNINLAQLSCVVLYKVLTTNKYIAFILFGKIIRKR